MMLSKLLKNCATLVLYSTVIAGNALAEEEIQEENGVRQICPGVTTTANKLYWDNEVSRNDSQEHLLFEALESDQFEYIYICGKKNYLGQTWSDLGGLNLKNLKTLDLDLFYSSYESETDLDESEDIMRNLFQKSHNLKVIFRSGNEVRREFKIKYWLIALLTCRKCYSNS